MLKVTMNSTEASEYCWDLISRGLGYPCPPLPDDVAGAQYFECEDDECILCCEAYKQGRQGND